MTGWERVIRGSNVKSMNNINRQMGALCVLNDGN